MDENLEKRRHSAAHVLAMAVIRLFPEAKLGVGPVTKDGFYQDVQTADRLKWEDIKRIEAEMNLIIQEDLAFSQFYTSFEEAFQLLLSRGQVYKSELLQQIQDQRVSFYKTGEEFVDLCRGPHVTSTNQIGAIKLMSVSDVHWKNDSDRPIIQRITGVAFATPEQLSQYLTKQEAVQKKDFLKSAEELGMIINDERIIYTPSGTTSIKTISNRIASVLDAHGFAETINFQTRDQQQISEQLHKIYKLKNRSYRTLPLRIYSQNLMEFKDTKDIQGKKLSSFILFTALTYCIPDNLGNHLQADLETMIDLCKSLNLDINVNVHTADLETTLVKKISEYLQKENISQTQVIDAGVPDDGLVIHIICEDDLDREWNILEMIVKPSQNHYVDAEGEFRNTIQTETRIITETIFAYYLENFDGSLPYWASPIQATVIPISENQARYGEKIAKLLVDLGFRTQLDDRGETMQARIRDAELSKVPVLVIVGEKEEHADAVSLRFRNKQELGMVSLGDLQTKLTNYLEDYSL